MSAATPHATGWAGEAVDLSAMQDVHTRRFPRCLEEAFPTPEWRTGFYGPYRREPRHGGAVFILAVVLALFLAWGVLA